MKKIISLLLISTMVAGCNNQGGFSVSNEEAGTVLGGIGGALLGSQVGGGRGQIAATAVGTLMGAALGSRVGKSLDRADMAYYNRASQNALETMPAGQTLPWSNPQSGVRGTVTPSSYYQTDNGNYCREYTQTITVGGRTEEGYGVACRQPDGSWKIQG
jgi:surface antigen